MTRRSYTAPSTSDRDHAYNLQLVGLTRRVPGSLLLVLFGMHGPGCVRSTQVVLTLQ